MKEPFRLLIAVPSTDYMHAEFVRSLMKLTGHLQREGIRHETEIVAGTLVYLARDKLACKAINDYVGQVKEGDKIKVSGNLKEETASVDVVEYLLQDDGTCVSSKIRHSNYIKADTDVTISVSRGDALLKSFRYVSDIKGTVTEDATVEYSESPVKVGTGFTKTYKTTTS